MTVSSPGIVSKSCFHGVTTVKSFDRIRA
eukprot:COSAG02_NODE_38941_length_423_cov_0.620370_2_plen_28_part_01